MIYSFLRRLLMPFIRVYYIRKYKDIWGLKERLNTKFSPIILGVYNYYISKYNSYIGYTSEIDKRGIYFPHGITGIFISGEAKIGKNCIIFQQVTIGSNTLRNSNIGAPKIGENVYIGAGAKIIGNITIGDNCRIGANAVVYKNMPNNNVAVCSKTRIIQKENLDNRFFKKIKNNWAYYDNGKWIIEK